MKTLEGNLVAQNLKVGIVCARFNEFIVSKLLSGCEDGLLRIVLPVGIGDCEVRPMTQEAFAALFA